VKQIPFSGPDITDKELEAVTEVIKSGWLAHGKYSKRLEELFREYTGAKHVITVSNCTAGLHLSCLAAGFGAGDEVIVPAQTHTATAHAVEYTGAKAVFADVYPSTGNISIEEIEGKISERTRGVIPVHMAGYPCEMDRIKKICDDRGLVLIEDCAHAIGTTYQGTHVGNFGAAGCFSFYPTKQITTGEGGVVASNDDTLAHFVDKHRAFGIDTPPELRTKPGVYDVRGLGYNFRMTDFQAALGVGQMERYAENVATRRANAKLYTELLADDNRFEVLEYSDEHSYYLFQVIVREPLSRDEMIARLKENGVGLSIHYATPVPLMTYYREKYAYTAEDFPNAVRYGKQSISLPVHQKVTQDDIRYVVETMKSAS